MVDGEALWDLFGRKPLMTWGRGGRGVELCSQKLNLAAVSVDRRGGQRWGGHWGPEQSGRDGWTREAFQSQNQ